MPTAADNLQESLDECRVAQAEWSAKSLKARLAVLREARYRLAHIASQLADAFPPTLTRTRADSYAAEILPLLAAVKFLEREAGDILKPQKLGSKGRPLWLQGVDTFVERVPFGIVLVIAPANYPLFLAGVQTLQALAAGNAVVWKPGLGGQAVANVFASALQAAGLPKNLLKVTEESPAAGVSALMSRPDKVFFTGSAQTGKEVLTLAADLSVPVVAELSGCDAVVVLPYADVGLVLDALTFGMRLNGSATCMAPRRLFLVGAGHENLLVRLHERFSATDGVPLSESTRAQLIDLIEQAVEQGAVVHGNLRAPLQKTILVENSHAGMRIAQADIFAPVLTVIEARDADAMIEMDKQCPFGLTVAIFGDEKMARLLGARLSVGTIIINDLIVSTADPRVSFGGRRGSGFGVTRGTEGLLEMTAVKTTAVRTRRASRQYQPTDQRHEDLFVGFVKMGHGSNFRHKLNGLRTLIAAARKLK